MCGKECRNPTCAEVASHSSSLWHCASGTSVLWQAAAGQGFDFGYPWYIRLNLVGVGTCSSTLITSATIITPSYTTDEPWWSAYSGWASSRIDVAVCLVAPSKRDASLTKSSFTFWFISEVGNELGAWSSVGPTLQSDSEEAVLRHRPQPDKTILWKVVSYNFCVSYEWMVIFDKVLQ